MTVTPDQVVAKRLRAEELRREISMLDRAKQDDVVVADLAVQDRALDDEIERLEAERARVVLTSPGGGSVAEALAAMELAESGAAQPSLRPTLDVVVETPKVTTTDNTKTEGEGN